MLAKCGSASGVNGKRVT